MERSDLALVEPVVTRLSRTSRNMADRDDRISDGMLGLAAGAELWDAREAELRRWFSSRESFLQKSIRRAVIDGLRLRNGRDYRGRSPDGVSYPRQAFEGGMLRLDRELAGASGESLYELVAGRDDGGVDEVESADLLAGLSGREEEVVRRTVIGGETYLAVADDLGVTESRVGQIRERGLARLRAGVPRPADNARMAREERRLTDRERQVLSAIADGKQNADIAKEMLLSEETIKSHLRHILAKLGARSRTHAVAIGFRRGLLS